MSVSVNVTSYFEVILGDRVLSAGRRTPVAITADGVVHDQTITLASAATAVKVFDDTEDIADFDFLFIVSTQDIYLELLVDQNDGVGNEYCTLPLKANIPFILARDDAYANLTPGTFPSGTLDTIERIRAYNISGSTATIRTVAIT